jgi:hypothetical protein
VQRTTPPSPAIPLRVVHAARFASVLVALAALPGCALAQAQPRHEQHPSEPSRRDGSASGDAATTPPGSGDPAVLPDAGAFNERDARSIGEEFHDGGQGGGPPSRAETGPPSARDRRTLRLPTTPPERPPAIFGPAGPTPMPRSLDAGATPLAPR